MKNRQRAPPLEDGLVKVPQELVKKDRTMNLPPGGFMDMAARSGYQVAPVLTPVKPAPVPQKVVIPSFPLSFANGPTQNNNTWPSQPTVYSQQSTMVPVQPVFTSSVVPNPNLAQMIRPVEPVAKPLKPMEFKQNKKAPPKAKLAPVELPGQHTQKIIAGTNKPQKEEDDEEELVEEPQKNKDLETIDPKLIVILPKKGVNDELIEKELLAEKRSQSQLLREMYLAIARSYLSQYCLLVGDLKCQSLRSSFIRHPILI